MTDYTVEELQKLLKKAKEKEKENQEASYADKAKEILSTLTDYKDDEIARIGFYFNKYRNKLEKGPKKK